LRKKWNGNVFQFNCRLDHRIFGKSLVKRLRQVWRQKKPKTWRILYERKGFMGGQKQRSTRFGFERLANPTGSVALRCFLE